MKIGIIGSGAIGLYYGARLQRSGCDVHFLLRSDFEAVSQRGLTVLAPDGDFELESVQAYASSSDMGEMDLVIVALKTTSNAALPEILKPLVGSNTAVLTLQNGLGNDAYLASLYPRNPILSGLCFVCINRTAPGVVENYMLGSVALGCFEAPASPLAREIGDLFIQAGVETRVSDSLQLMQWKKLVWNIPFNGLGIVAGGVATDVIVGDPGLLALTKGLMEEVISAGSHMGMRIEDSFIDLQIDRTRKMGAYNSSSMIDFVEKRPVEVEAIWGEPLRQAQAAGCSMPKLEALYQLIAYLCSTR